jgi:ClpP class serine protease
VQGSSLVVLCSGNKCFANKFSVFGDYGYAHTSFGMKELARNWDIERKYIHSGRNKVKLNTFEDLKTEDVEW